MSYTFKVVDVELGSPEGAVLVGYVESGEICGLGRIDVQTDDGPFTSFTTGAEVDGSMAVPAKVGRGHKVFLSIDTQPPRDLPLPCVAVGGDGGRVRTANNPQRPWTPLLSRLLGRQQDVAAPR